MWGSKIKLCRFALGSCVIRIDDPKEVLCHSVQLVLKNYIHSEYIVPIWYCCQEVFLLFTITNNM